MKEQVTADNARSAVARFFSNVMEPLARITMRFGYSAREACDATRWSFVRSYYRASELWSADNPTDMEASIKTGLTRPQVKLLRNVPGPDHAIFSNRQNLAYRVIEGWVNDPEYHKNGVPMALPLRHQNGPTFNKLVIQYGANTTFHPVLRDLKSAGCIEVKNDIVILKSATYGLHLMDEERMELTAFMLKRLAESTEHNLIHNAVEDRRMQRVWRQVLIPEGQDAEVRRQISESRFEPDERPMLSCPVSRIPNETMASNTLKSVLSHLFIKTLQSTRKAAIPTLSQKKRSSDT